MSQENVELVRQAYEVFDSDLDALLRLLDAEIEWVSPSDSIEPGSRHGHKGVRDAFAATAMAWDLPTHTPSRKSHKTQLEDQGVSASSLAPPGMSQQLHPRVTNRWRPRKKMVTFPWRPCEPSSTRDQKFNRRSRTIF